MSLKQTLKKKKETGYAENEYFFSCANFLFLIFEGKKGGFHPNSFSICFSLLFKKKKATISAGGTNERTNS
jgi:hypothetical protein